MTESASRYRGLDNLTPEQALEVQEDALDPVLPGPPGTTTEAVEEPATPAVAEPPVKPKRRHPAAGDGPIFPLADAGEYYIGLWCNIPNYGCPYCAYATVSGPGAVELHILAYIDKGDLSHSKALELQ